MKLSPNRKSKTTKPHANNTHFENYRIPKQRNGDTCTPSRKTPNPKTQTLKPQNDYPQPKDPTTQRPKDPQTQRPKDPPTQPHPKCDQIPNPFDFKNPEVYTFSTLRARGSTPNIQFANVKSSNRPWRGGGRQQLFTLFDLCVSSLRRGHANLLCIVPIWTDDPRRESNNLVVRKRISLRT
jgi:hypothetical protein